ncbi:MAG TPA: hypothetical protein VN879_16075 [Candidatus Acidoferrales bacterium]|nr:hypothetical protein [Candidatus Acidoferrales bacterium]
MQLIERGDPEESSYLQLALEIWQQLDKAYPDHPWQVSFQGGAMIVRHAVINADVSVKLKREGFGFLLDKSKLDNPKEVTQSAVMAGGAMLELFGMKRGKWDGSDPVIPSDWTPKQEAGFA